MSYPLHHFVPSVDELALATRLLEMNSWNRTDSLSVDTAIGIFKQSGLSFKQLREIWSIADKDGSGKLSREELAIVIRLMGWVQAGETLGENLLEKTGPLPKIKGISDVVTTAKTEIEFPPLTVQNTLDLKQAFLDADPINGTLHNRKVMAIYMGLKPDLSFETLFRIMKLVERDQFGEIGFKTFALGMHIVQNLHIFPISSEHISVPPEIYNTLDAIETTLSEHQSLISFHPLSPLLDSDDDEPNGIRLPTLVDSNVQEFMRRLKEHQTISGDMIAKFMLPYKVEPIELAKIWRQANIDSERPLSTRRLTLIEQLVRETLATKVYRARASASPPPSYHIRPTDQESTRPLPSPEPSSRMDSVLEDFSFVTPYPISMDPPEYKHQPSPAATSKGARPQTPSLPPLHPTLDPSFLSSFQEQIGRVTAQLETVALEQTATQNELQKTVKSLQDGNIQCQLREQELQTELARKEVEYDEAEKLLGSMRFEALEKDTTIKECLDGVEGVVAESEALKDTVDTQNKQIASLLDLVASLESTIKELHLNPAHNDLRLGFLRASIRSSEAAIAKAISETDDLRQTVRKQEEEIADLRERLEEKQFSLPVSRIDKDLLTLREDHEGLKAQVEKMESLLAQHVLSPIVHDQNQLVVGGERKPSITPGSASSSISFDISSSIGDARSGYSTPEPPPNENQRQPFNIDSQLERDLSLLRSDIRLKGYMGPEMVQRFISEYGLDASFLDEIGRITELDVDDWKTVDVAINLIHEAISSGRGKSSVPSQYLHRPPSYRPSTPFSVADDDEDEEDDDNDDQDEEEMQEPLFSKPMPNKQTSFGSSRTILLKSSHKAKIFSTPLQV